MSGSFDNNGSGPKGAGKGPGKGSGEGAGKRPTPTIEGTATEVRVDPDRDEPTSDLPVTGPATDEPGSEPAAPEAETPDDVDAPAGAEGDTQAERGSGANAPPKRASFAAVLLGGLTSLFTHAFAGLVGGLAVLLAIALGYLPLGAFKDSAGIGLLEDRIAKLEQAPETPDNTAALDEVEQRLAALESKVPETPPEVTALSDRVTQLEASLKSMSEVAKEGGSLADAAAITRQITEAEKRFDAKIQSTVQSEVQSALAGAKAETTADTKAIDDLKAEIADVDAKLKALAEAKLDSDQAALLLPEITVLDERLGRIESTLPQLAKAVDEGGAETKKATLAIAFANLREAVNEGHPYTSELSTLAVLSPGALDLGSLLDYEETGIPTVRALTASFDEMRDEALAAEPASEGASLVGRLLGSAESLVKVRRIDEAAEGDSPDAVLSRAAAKLNEGELDAAVTEIQILKGPLKETFAGWLDEARARLDARTTLRRLQNILLVSLGPSETGPDEAGKNKTEEQE